MILPGVFDIYSSEVSTGEGMEILVLTGEFWVDHEVNSHKNLPEIFYSACHFFFLQMPINYSLISIMIRLKPTKNLDQVLVKMTGKFENYVSLYKGNTNILLWTLGYIRFPLS